MMFLLAVSWISFPSAHIYTWIRNFANENQGKCTQAAPN